MDPELQGFVLLQLALEKTTRIRHFFHNTTRREDVGVFEFVLAVLEVFQLYSAFVHQRFGVTAFRIFFADLSGFIGIWPQWIYKNS